jgi:hypothetical protein
MHNRRTLVLATLLGSLGLLSACTDEAPTRPDSPDAALQLFGAGNVTANAAVGMDAQLMDMARDIPGFGGMYRDESGAVNVYLHRDDLRLTTAERASIASRISDLIVPNGDGAMVRGEQIVVKRGEYDFPTLHGIRRSVAPVLSMEGVVFTDSDEARNRVTIGVLDDAAAARVEQRLAALGVDSDAVHIMLTEPIYPMATLREVIRPVVGGLQIWRFIPPGSASICTLGFNVRSPAAPNVHGFVTNSHCTEERSTVTGTLYNQKPLVLPPEYIAQEVWDLPYFTCQYQGFVCRFSDAAGILYLPGVPNTHGQIARTTFAGVGSPTSQPAGSLEIDPVNPHWTIVAERPFPMVGDVLHKTGRTTGWTTGLVTQTCFDSGVSGTNPPVAMLCQDRVQAGVGGGDSGSPVFERIGETGNVRLVGILWGSGAGAFVMSAMDNIRFENVGPAPWTTFPGQTPPPAIQ